MDQQLLAKMLVVEQYTTDNIPWEPGTEPFSRQGMGFEVEDIPPSISVDDVYVVMYSYVLGGWKALLSTIVPDNKYYEVTYNVAKQEAYIDTYVKLANAVANPT